MKRPRKTAPTPATLLDAPPAAAATARTIGTAIARPIHPGSCVWMGGGDEAGDCTACGKKHGIPGCGDPKANGGA